MINVKKLLWLTFVLIGIGCGHKVKTTAYLDDARFIHNDDTIFHNDTNTVFFTESKYTDGRLEKDGSVTVSLEETPGTGAKWVLKDSKGFLLLKQEIKPHLSMPGSKQKRTFYFKANESGNLKFEYKRGDGIIFDTASFSVEVLPKGYFENEYQNFK